MLVKVFIVAAGSALGGLTRWGMSEASGHVLGRHFPWGTLLINILGSLFLDWLYTLLADRMLDDPDWQPRADQLRLLLGVGFAGGFTTFSAYEWEAHQLLHTGHFIKAAAYLAGSVFLGLTALHVGTLLAR